MESGKEAERRTELRKVERGVAAERGIWDIDGMIGNRKGRDRRG